MSIERNGISTIREAWKNAAEEETRPATIPAEYPDNRALPNVTSILAACGVSINPAVSYTENQCVKFEDLLVAPRDLSFTVHGQTTTTGSYVNVSPSMIESMTLNGVQLTQQQLTDAYQLDGVYKFTGYQNTKVNIVIDASYNDQSIIYRQYSEQSTYKSFNNRLILLRDINSRPLTELKYSWTTSGADIDLNFFVIKNNDGTHEQIGMFGYDQAISGDGVYYPVPKASPVKVCPSTGCDFCLSLDVDDRGQGSLTEILTIYPADMTWTLIMQNYDFVYAAIDYDGNNNMKGMSAKLSSDDYPVSKEISLDSSASTINSWVICRFGSTTNGQIVEYKTASNESLVYDSNGVTVPAATSLVGIDLIIKQGSNWRIS